MWELDSLKLKFHGLYVGVRHFEVWQFEVFIPWVEHQTQRFKPWNEDPKLPDLKISDSHIQPMQLQLSTVQLSHPTHGMKASNCPTLMSNPWNEGLKPSDSHVQPLAK